MNSKPDENSKIPLRLLVIAAVALASGMVVGCLTWLSTDSDVPASVLAGVVAAAGVLAWLFKNVA